MTAESSSPVVWRAVAVVAVCALLLAGGRTLAHHLSALDARIAAMGAWGPVVFVAGFAVAGMAFVPAGLLTLAAGAIFGLVHGTLYALAGAMIGAVGSFLLARHVARDVVERRMSAHPRIAAVTSGITDHGRKIVLLLRLSPVVPYSVINYSMGITRIPLADFTLASFGMLPVTLMYVYYGTVAGTIVEASEEHVHKGREYYVFLALGLIATVIATTIVTRTASRALARESDSPQ